MDAAAPGTALARCAATGAQAAASEEGMEEAKRKAVIASLKRAVQSTERCVNTLQQALATINIDVPLVVRAACQLSIVYERDTSRGRCTYRLPKQPSRVLLHVPQYCQIGLFCGQLCEPGVGPPYGLRAYA